MEPHDDRTEAIAATLASTQFIHIPGPNPILKPGPEGSWDSGVLEACDMLKDVDTYHLYYHGTSPTSSYQVGVVTASHPLGPFSRPVAEPVLPVGPKGSWDSACTACAAILKEGPDRYLMFYSAKAQGAGPGYSVGLAYAESPLGPWRKHEGNPLLPQFGYVGGVVLLEGTYYLYTEHPVGARGDDYGPFSLATAGVPEGPWTVHEEYVLQPGEWGEWDDGGMSEAKVFRQGGLFHCFYGGAKLDPVRIRTKESIGYAYSLDGVHFAKHPLNPVAPREANPNAAAFAEVHAHWEPPFVYCYHTHRYNDAEGVVEDLGVQVLAMQRPFGLTMPVLLREALGAGETTALPECPPVALAAVRSCALTVEATYPADAQAGLGLHVRASRDGLACDTEDLCAFTLPCRPGETVRATFAAPAGPQFLKCLVDNPGLTPVVALRVDATLEG
jgi:hypothetical protein